jgi:predicted dehydrogenase/threonine dehydrogenase-like Zn-dependent dehydrogenase
MPRPAVEPGTVLVRVHYSLISVGTEIAALRPAWAAMPGATTGEKLLSVSSVFKQYLGKALRNPGKAVRKIVQLSRQAARSAVRRAFPPRPHAANGTNGNGNGASHAPASEMEDQGWNVGYSAAGEVLEAGEGVAEFVPGDWVACAGAGQANHADYVCVRKNLVCRVPSGCDLRSAATTTVGTIALQGVRRAAPQLGETVAVLGLGLIGQITVQLLRANGCRVFGLDLDPQRIERAKACGLDGGATDAESFQRLLRDRTGGRGADRTLITAATKSSTVINQAMEITRAKGTVVIVGDVGMNVERAAFYRKEINLLMSTSYGPGRYDPVYEEDGRDYPFAHVRWTLNRNMQAYLDLIAAKRIDVEELLDRVVPVEEAPAVYRELAAASGPLPLGVLLHYPDDTVVARSPDRATLPEPADSTRLTLRGHKRVLADRIRYALVGAGSFGTAMLVPAMEKRKDRFFLRGVVSRNASQGGNFARSHQVETFTSDLDAILRDPGFDLVVIATRHHEHAGQVVRSLKAGKHVFVEKPLALNWPELDEIARTYAELPDKPLLMVGFNRRFAPPVRLLQEILAKRRSPLVLNYRLHGGYIPLDHWVQGPQGGGRNLGEACHIYDLFRSLAGADVTGIQASAIDPGALPYRRNDNFCAGLTYEDGSIASLVYTALGPKAGLGKERLEVFCDGEAYLLDDYKGLTRAGDGKVLWSSAEADKGHAEEMSRLGDALADGGPAPIPFNQLIETTAVALHVEDLLHKRNLDDDQAR